MKTLPSAAVSGSSSDPHSSVSSLPMAGMSFGRRSLADAVECPKCGKRSIVERSSNIFDCLNCSFHRELPPIAGRNSQDTRTDRLSSAGKLRHRSGLSPLANPYGGRQRQGLSQRATVAHQEDGTVVDPLQRRVIPSLSQGQKLSQRNSLNALLSSEAHRASLDRLSFDLNEEGEELDPSQPWMFALLAVVFGILLL